MKKKQQKIVLTGAPGTGKSTIINALEEKAYTCLHEISRDITLEAREKGTEQLFLKEPLLFSDLLLKGREEQFNHASSIDTEFVFFDRGIPDVHAYMNYIGMDYPQRFIESSKIHKYDFVFLMPPWEDIYTTDNERYETFEQSLAIHNHLLRTYNSLGYSVVEVPKGDVKKRMEYILNVINTFK